METLLCGYEGYAAVRIGHCKIGFRGVCRTSSGVFFRTRKEVDVFITQWNDRWRANVDKPGRADNEVVALALREETKVDRKNCY